MRDSYQDSPAQARDAGLRRLTKLTWRTTQLGALVTVGFAVVFARSAPAKTANVQTATSAKPTPAARTPAPGAAQHRSKPLRATSPVATQSAAGQPTAQPSAPAAQASAPTTQPAVPAAQPSAAPVTPRLTPPANPPTPAPSSAAPAPTTSSASHGVG